LSSTRAAERDRAGEQYALTLAMFGRLLAIIEVAWGSSYCAVWFFDDQLRRVLQVDCRRLAENHMFVVGGRQWSYTEAEQVEFAENVTWGEYEMSLDGRQNRSVYLGSATPTAWLEDMAVPEHNQLDVPAFGGWAQFIRAFPDHLGVLGLEISPAAVIEDVSDPAGNGLPARMRPWHPPQPQGPGRLDLLFTPGT
jgi:hypothetical protein